MRGEEVEGEGPSRSLLTRDFALLLVTQASFGYAFSGFFLLPKYLTTELSAGPVEIGLLAGLYGVATVISMFAMGVAVDRIGRRPFLTAGAVLMSLASAAFVFVDEVGPLLFSLRALQGVAFAMAFVAGATLTVDQAPPERLGLAIGIFGLTMLSMNAVAPAVMEFLAERRGWPVGFASAAGVAALSAILSSFVPERRPRPSPGARIPSLLEVARQPRQIRVAIVVVVVGAAFGTMFTYNQPFALELGISQVRSFFVAYAAAGVAARVGLGPFIDGFGRHRASIASLLLYALAVSAMIELRPGGLAPIGAIFGLAHGLFYPAFNALAVEAASDNERGKVMALFQGWFNVGFAGGAFALGFLAEAAGYRAVFGSAGLATFAVLVLLVLSPEGRPARRRVS
ncbi:MAG: MFS transporter [Myxococcota bacterium]